MSPPSGAAGAWFWAADGTTDSWRPYGPSESQVLEEAFSAGRQLLSLTVHGQSYVVLFEAMQQRNRVTGNSRNIRRVVPEAPAATAAAAAAAPDLRELYFSAHPDALLAFIGLCLVLRVVS